MANTFYTPTEAAKATVAALRHLSTLPRTVRMDFAGEFVAGRGGSVDVLAPISAGEAKVYTAENRAAGDAIEYNDLNETYINVKLENQLYNAVKINDFEGTFTIQDLATQVLRPQAESVVNGLAIPLIAEMTAIANDVESPVSDIAVDGSNALQAIIEARKVLNARKVPTANRFLAVGADVEAILLGLPQLQKVNEAGDGGDALRRATLGNLFGFQIVADASLPADFAIAFERDAFAFVTRPGYIPAGAAKGAHVAQDGFALRWVQDYDPDYLVDRSVVDTFYGAATLDAQRAVSFKVAGA